MAPTLDSSGGGGGGGYTSSATTATTEAVKKEKEEEERQKNQGGGNNPRTNPKDADPQSSTNPMSTNDGSGGVSLGKGGITLGSDRLSAGGSGDDGSGGGSQAQDRGRDPSGSTRGTRSQRITDADPSGANDVDSDMSASDVQTESGGDATAKGDLVNDARANVGGYDQSVEVDAADDDNIATQTTRQDGVTTTTIDPNTDDGSQEDVVGVSRTEGALSVVELEGQDAQGNWETTTTTTTTADDPFTAGDTNDQQGQSDNTDEDWPQPDNDPAEGETRETARPGEGGGGRAPGPGEGGPPPWLNRQGSGRFGQGGAGGQGADGRGAGGSGGVLGLSRGQTVAAGAGVVGLGALAYVFLL